MWHLPVCGTIGKNLKPSHHVFITAIMFPSISVFYDISEVRGER